MASIHAAASGTARCYLLAGAMLLAPLASAFGQSLPEQPRLGMALDAATTRELPASNNPFALFDGAQTEAISDRFVAGGLNAATPPLTGGLLNSWTQTQFRFGDVNITDPRIGGVPLFVPFAPFLSATRIGAGAMAIDDNAPALSMSFEPLRPTAGWLRAVEIAGTGGALTGKGRDTVPAVDRLNQGGDVSAAFTGPINARLGLAAAASWRGISHVAAPSVDSTSDNVGTAFTQLVWAASPRDDLSAVGLIERATTTPAESTTVHAQGAWQHRVPDRAAWRLFAGYTERRRTATLASVLAVDSLTSDPVPDFFDTGNGTSRRWTVGARVTPAASNRLPSFGVDIENAKARIEGSGIREIHESVDGVPARLWSVADPAGPDFRQLTTIGAFANERVTVGQVTLEAGLRLDTAHGSAAAAEHGVSWASWLPRAAAEWQVTQKAGVVLSASYRRSAYQMPLNVLAVGDPNAPIADVARWTGATTGPLIARVGPGTGGDSAFSQIDQNLERPLTDELVLAIRATPFRRVDVELARVTKRESPLLSLVDDGVPSSSFTSFSVPDPSYIPETAGPFDHPTTTVFNRPANAYGLDRYRLTNATGDPGESWAMELNVRVTTERVVLLLGTALTWAYGPAAAIGFLPTENDQNVVGNVLVDPNRDHEARGQLFQDRSHVAKLAGVYRFAPGFSLGAIARYQDGQPFSRVVAVNEGLNQGPALARAYRNGGAAFTYTGTLDIRLQRAWKAGAGEITAGIDIYNLPSMGKEVSEYVVAGPLFRTPTALQPPRTGLLSLRFAY